MTSAYRRGVIGAACARAAARCGARTVLFEPGPDPAAASAASAGLLAAQIEPTDPEALATAVRARDLYESLAPELREATGIDIGFWREGIASVALDEPPRSACKRASPRSARRACVATGSSPRDVGNAGPPCHPPAWRAICAGRRRRGRPRAHARTPGRRTAGRCHGPQRARRARGHRGKRRDRRRRGRQHRRVRTRGRGGRCWSSRLAGLPRPLPVEPVRGQMMQTPWPPACRARAVLRPRVPVERGGKAVLAARWNTPGSTVASRTKAWPKSCSASPGSCPAGRTHRGARLGRPAALSPDGLPIVGRDADVDRPGLCHRPRPQRHSLRRTHRRGRGRSRDERPDPGGLAAFTPQRLWRD